MLDHNSAAAATTSYLHNDRQFPPCDNNWICHLGHPWKNERIETLKKMLMGKGIGNTAQSSSTGLEMSDSAVEFILKLVQTNMTFSANVMDIAHVMFAGKPF
jgi:hypothetical protein